MDNIIKIKQDEELYHCCLAAESARDEKDYESCSDAIRKAYRRMAVILTGEGTDEEILSGLKEKNLLTERSLAVYADALTKEMAKNQLACDNAMLSLQEEVDKFAAFYWKGLTPRTMEELEVQYYDGKNSTRNGRATGDGIFRVLLLGGLIVVGLVLILLSAFVDSMSNWFVGGIVFAGAGILFSVMNAKVKK